MIIVYISYAITRLNALAIGGLNRLKLENRRMSLCLATRVACLLRELWRLTTVTEVESSRYRYARSYFIILQARSCSSMHTVQ
jgi:hypothetical protein